MSQEPNPLTDFGGTARLFPLPNLVLFPHVAQPLHIFEPRYREMMADALEDDRLLGMALLQSGWEEDYHLKPPLHPMICLGRIVQEEKLSDGRYNLLLQGLTRARILEERSTAKLYRIARVELCEEEPPAAASAKALRRELGDVALGFFAAHAAAQEQLRQLVASGLPLGALCDILAFALPVDLEVKQALLEELAVEARVRRLLGDLAGRTPAASPEEKTRRQFPPSFSSN